jgi:hypothetical protein
MPTSTASLALQPLSSHSRRVFRRPDNFGPNCNENLATTCSMVGNLPVLLLPLVICYLLLWTMDDRVMVQIRRLLSYDNNVMLFICFCMLFFRLFQEPTISQKCYQ